MFKSALDGYDKNEVDEYITQLKGELLEQKFSLLEAEKKSLALQNEREEIDAKEKSILHAIKVFEDNRKVQEEGSKSMYALKIEQMTLVYRKFEDVIQKIYLLHPEIKSDRELSVLVSELEDVLTQAKGEGLTGVINSPISSSNDSMRVLLSKMQEHRRSGDYPKEVKIARINVKKQPEVEESGFDLKEAVNPKMDLQEIMKAFDFFNNDEKN